MLYGNSFSEFLAMGNHGVYVWGSVAVTALCMIAEPMLVARGRKQLIARLRRQQRSEKSECSERSESSARRFR